MVTQRVQSIQEDLPDFYRKVDDGILTLWIDAFADELDEFQTNLDAAKLELFAQTATGTFLDRIGLMVDVIRDVGESDADLRGRILSKATEFIGGGTLGSIITNFANRFNITIDVEQRTDFIPWIRVFMDNTEFIASGITIAEAQTFLDEIKAAGVGTTLGFLITGEETVTADEQDNPIIDGVRFGRYNDGLSLYNDITVYK